MDFSSDRGIDFFPSLFTLTTRFKSLALEHPFLAPSPDLDESEKASQDHQFNQDEEELKKIYETYQFQQILQNIVDFQYSGRPPLAPRRAFMSYKK